MKTGAQSIILRKTGQNIGRQIIRKTKFLILLASCPYGNIQLDSYKNSSGATINLKYNSIVKYNVIFSL